MKLPVSYLFVPGDRPDRFAKALASGAHSVIVDLEDAVSAEAKASARQHIRAWRATQPGSESRLLVRINDASTSWFEADLALIQECAISAVVLPKTERVGDIARVRNSLPRDGWVVPIIETARGASEMAGSRIINKDAMTAR